MHNQDLTDEELVVYVKQEDKEAYSFIIDRYQRRIRAYINRLINNQEEANDLAQQTLVNAYVNLHGFDSKRKFSSWLYRIAHNLAVNWLKRKKATISLDANEVVASRLSAEIDISKEIMSNDTKKALSDALDKLPVKFREPFILRYLEGKTYEEISDILRKNKNTIGTIIFRAKKILKNELKNIYEQKY